ncbi:MAG: hypothetical protein KKF41_13150 [Actinobacteria bacterium]|nr:hypothetical protein [Actinomycetota bacterium]MBU1944028.1 hypothetical protein [Actinomycetota bacterium]MBU2688524.1 hypothetical protein [Actinomycetota bacterium]
MAGSRRENGGVLQALVFSTLIPRCTLSYIGAGTGSLIIQVVIAVFAGALVALKIYWRNITAFFRRRKAVEDEAPPPAEAAAGDGLEELLPLE